jgi:hypothetical protein
VASDAGARYVHVSQRSNEFKDAHQHAGLVRFQLVAVAREVWMKGRLRSAWLGVGMLAAVFPIGASAGEVEWGFIVVSGKRIPVDLGSQCADVFARISAATTCTADGCERPFRLATEWKEHCSTGPLHWRTPEVDRIAKRLAQQRVPPVAASSPARARPSRDSASGENAIEVQPVPLLSGCADSLQMLGASQTCVGRQCSLALAQAERWQSRCLPDAAPLIREFFGIKGVLLVRDGRRHFNETTVVIATDAMDAVPTSTVPAPGLRVQRMKDEACSASDLCKAEYRLASLCGTDWPPDLPTYLALRRTCPKSGSALLIVVSTVPALNPTLASAPRRVRVSLKSHEVEVGESAVPFLVEGEAEAAISAGREAKAHDLEKKKLAAVEIEDEEVEEREERDRARREARKELAETKRRLKKMTRLDNLVDSAETAAQAICQNAEASEKIQSEVDALQCAELERKPRRCFKLIDDMRRRDANFKQINSMMRQLVEVAVREVGPDFSQGIVEYYTSYTRCWCRGDAFEGTCR